MDVVLQDAVSVRNMFENLLSSDVYYINVEDEPTVYCVDETNGTVMFDRLVRFTSFALSCLFTLVKALECLPPRRRLM